MPKSILDALADIEVAVIEIGFVNGEFVANSLKADLWGRLSGNLKDQAISAKGDGNSLSWQKFLHLLPDHEIEELANTLNDWAAERRVQISDLFKLAITAELLPNRRRFDALKHWDGLSESQQEKAFVAMDSLDAEEDSVSFLKWLKLMDSKELVTLHEQIRSALMEKVGSEIEEVSP